MKLMLIVLNLFIFTSIASARLPICSANSTKNCVLAEKDGHIALIEMMLENKEGTELLYKTGTNGLILDPAAPLTRVTLVSTTDTMTVLKYEVKLLDCRGTDACGGSYLWTVDATTEGDGYTSKTTFINTLSKL